MDMTEPMSWTEAEHPVTGTTRRHLLAALAAASLAPQALSARAAAWPEKPITMVLPFPPGGSVDPILRTLAKGMQDELGQPIVLMHKPGGGAVIGIAGVAQMGDADGYTLGLMHNSVLRQPFVTKVDWDPLRDLSYIAGLLILNAGVAVAADAPWHTMDELLADAKKRPGEISWGNVGLINIYRIYAERYAKAEGAKFNFIPFKGSGEGLNSLIGHHIDVYGDPGFGPMARGGKVRVLATFTDQRLAAWPQVPTLKELGHDLVPLSPFGLVAPKNLDAGISAKLQAAIRVAEKQPEYQKLIADFDYTPWPTDAPSYRAFAEAQSVREKQMLDQLGFKPE